MRKLKGIVISDKMDKTLVVNTDRLKKHPKYLKQYRISRKFKVHDDKNEYRRGDIVVIQETKPLSKDKRWKVVELVKRPPVAEASQEEQEEEASS